MYSNNLHECSSRSRGSKLGYRIIITLAVALAYCILTADGKLHPHNDIITTPNENAEIGCESETKPAPELQWFKNGVELHDKPGKYHIFKYNGSLEVEHVGEEQIGPYVCVESPTSNATAVINAAPFATADKAKEVSKGQSVDLTCNAWGYPVPVIEWFMNSKKVAADGTHTVFSNTKTKYNNYDLVNGKLTIKNTVVSDSAKYTCRAVNSFGDFNETTIVRVRDPIAWVWPLVGIVAELGVIGGGIGYYEHNKKKEEKVAQQKH